MFNKSLAILLGGCLSALVQTSMAQTPYFYSFTFNNAAQTTQYFDFSAVSPYANHVKYGTWTLWGSANTPYVDIQLQGVNTGTCYDFQLLPGSGTAQNTDLVAFVGNDPNNKIDDDGPNGSLLPLFKVYAQSGTNIRISAYNNAYKGVDFSLRLNSKIVQNQTECLNSYSGPSEPMADYYHVIVGPTSAN